jgi:hypothetical protein
MKSWCAVDLECWEKVKDVCLNKLVKTCHMTDDVHCLWVIQTLSTSQLVLFWWRLLQKYLSASFPASTDHCSLIGPCIMPKMIENRDISNLFDDLEWPGFAKQVWLLLYAHGHRSVLGAAGHITLTTTNQLMVMGLKLWSLSNPGFKPRTFRTLAQRAYHLR